MKVPSVQTMATGFSAFLKLYGEALQALVQGYREVTMDTTNSYKFKDGMTVHDKMQRYD